MATETITRNNSTRTAGFVLIGLGVAFLLSRIIPGFGQLIWAAGFFGGAAFVYSTYSKDRAKWGWLLLAYSLAIPGALLVMDIFGLDRLIPAALLTSFALPFLYAYSLDRKQWGWLVPAAMFLLPASIIVLGVVWAFIPVALVLAGVYLLVRAANADDAKAEAEETVKSPVNGVRPLELPATQVEYGPEADV